jgi:hypothetical protein
VHEPWRFEKELKFLMMATITQLSPLPPLQLVFFPSSSSLPHFFLLILCLLFSPSLLQLPPFETPLRKKNTPRKLEEGASLPSFSFMLLK